MGSRSKKILELVLTKPNVDDQGTNNQSVIISNRCEQPNLEKSDKIRYCVDSKEQNSENIEEISEFADAKNVAAIEIEQETNFGSSSSEEDPFGNNSDLDPNYVPSESSDPSEANKDNLDKVSSSENDDDTADYGQGKDGKLYKKKIISITTYYFV